MDLRRHQKHNEWICSRSGTSLICGELFKGPQESLLGVFMTFAPLLLLLPLLSIPFIVSIHRSILVLVLHPHHHDSAPKTLPNPPWISPQPSFLPQSLPHPPFPQELSTDQQLKANRVSPSKKHLLTATYEPPLENTPNRSGYP